MRKKNLFNNEGISEDIRHEEIDEREQFLGVVLKRSSRQQKTHVALHPVERVADRARGIFDAVGLVCSEKNQ